MATRAELLKSLQGLGTGLSQMQENMRTAKSFEADQAEKKAQADYLAKYRPLALQGQQQQNDQAALGLEDSKLKLEGSKKLVAARDALDQQTNADWGFLTPEEKQNAPAWRAELNILNRNSDKPMSPQEYVRLKRENMAEEKRKQGKYQSELENDKSQREYYAALSGKATADANRPKPSDIPIDVKAEVSALSGKTAGKVSIANQIDSYIKEFDNAKSADDKVRIGRQMLKVLNSPEGADAVGAEEAKRLGDALEYHMGNVGSLVGATPGKFIGRDLEGFGRQAKATLESVRGSVNANRDEVDRLMGRSPADGQGIGKGQSRSPSMGSGSGGPPQISTDQEFDSLPSGTIFIDPQGNRRRKP